MCRIVERGQDSLKRRNKHQKNLLSFDHLLSTLSRMPVGLVLVVLVDHSNTSGNIEQIAFAPMTHSSQLKENGNGLA